MAYLIDNFSDNSLDALKRAQDSIFADALAADHARVLRELDITDPIVKEQYYTIFCGKKMILSAEDAEVARKEGMVVRSEKIVVKRI